MVFYRRIYLNDIELLDKDKPSILNAYLEMKEFLRTGVIDYEPKESEVYKRFAKRYGDSEDSSRLQESEEEPKETIQEDGGN